MKPKIKAIEELQQEALSLYHSKTLSPSKIGEIVGRSPCTIYRWLNTPKDIDQSDQQFRKYGRPRPKTFSDDIFAEIKRLKVEIPARSATKIQNILIDRGSREVPSLSTIRKFLAKEGLSVRKPTQRKGYVKFERILSEPTALFSRNARFWSENP